MPNDTVSSKTKITGPETRGFQAHRQGFSAHSNSSSLRGQSNGNDNGSISSSTDVSTIDTSNKHSTEERMQVDGSDYHQLTSSGGAPMVEESPVTLERSIIPASSNRSGHLHGLLRQPLGSSHQRDNNERIMVEGRSEDAHQLEGANVYLDCCQPSSSSGTN
ncbi:hypothetical protein BGZ76_006848, partial [Entomortierella beljakovae]